MMMKNIASKSNLALNPFKIYFKHSLIDIIEQRKVNNFISKFIYSEMATKIWQNLPVDLNFV